MTRGNTPSNLYVEMQQRIAPLYTVVTHLIDAGKIDCVHGYYTIGSFPNKLDNHLAKLLGYEDGHDMAVNFRSETQDTFDLFGRTKGLDARYTLYRALEEKRK